MDTSYLGTQLTKGQVYSGRVIRVGNAPEAYQDKHLYPTIIRSTEDSDNSLEIKPSDFSAKEVVVANTPSLLSQKLFEEVKFVVIMPGNGQKATWIKLDTPIVSSGLEDRDKMFLSRDAFKIAADLIVSGKSDKFSFSTINVLAKRIADQIIALSKSI